MIILQRFLRLSRGTRGAALGLAAVAIFTIGPLAVQANEGSLVGVWSTSIAGAGGVAVEISLGFGADGSLQQHVGAGRSETFYSGVYSLAPNGTLAYRIDDYVPKARCTGGACVPVRPAMPIGQVLTAHVDAVGTSSFIFIEAQETHVFTRQR
jgi:hypothetical protein